MKRCVFAAVLAGSVVGCDSDTAKREATPAATFTPDTPESGPSVILRRRGGEGVAVDVVAQRIPRGIHGAAFRLHWDPDGLIFRDARAGSAWSRDAVALAKEGTPGELVVVWTERGAGPLVQAAEEAVLGTLTFETRPQRVARPEVTVEFRAERSTLRDADDLGIDVNWRGGRVDDTPPR